MPASSTRAPLDFVRAWAIVQPAGSAGAALNPAMTAIRDSAPPRPDGIGDAAVVAALRELGRAAGSAFFETLVRVVATTLGVRYALVGQLTGPGEDRVRTLAVWANGHRGEDIEYSLAGTPCADVVRRRPCAYASAVVTGFPQDRLLAEMGADRYVGTPLRDGDGVLGLLAGVHDGPLHDGERALAVLEIFADDAATESRRRRDEDALKVQSQIIARIHDKGAASTSASSGSTPTWN